MTLFRQDIHRDERARSPGLSTLRFRPSFSFAGLLVLLATLWLAGGASRPDAFGQLVVRSVAIVLMIGATLVLDRPPLGRLLPVAFLLLAAFALPLFQLIPLPPSIWTALPGRSLFEEAARASGQPQPWRPWSISPGATANAAASLLIPAATLMLSAGLRTEERERLSTVMLSFIVMAMLLGLLQFSGSALDNPFVNDTVGQVSGIFANRNHFALMLAYGCLVLPSWALADRHQLRWRGPMAICLSILFVLTILATGSRAGLALGILALAIGFAVALRDLKRALRHYPRWVVYALPAGLAALLLGAVMLSVASHRAISIDRILDVNSAGDIRVLARPTVSRMVETYFPAGSGLGGFDTIFRIHEPLGLLKLTYFNHAHNDFLELALDAGVAGLAILAIALGWWARTSVRAWRAGHSRIATDAKIGSGIILLTALASVFDYPARTPTIMAFLALAAIWLSDRAPPKTS